MDRIFLYSDWNRKTRTRKNSVSGHFLRSARLYYSKCAPLSEFLKVTVKYRNHPRILKLGEACHSSNAINFSFSTVKRKQILKQLTQLNFSKADIFADFIRTRVNQSVANTIFPSSLKNADITPVFNKGDRNSKDNYRPVSILSHISKILNNVCFHNFQNGVFPLKI